MGAVYQALDESLQRYVALKVIHSAGGSAIDTKQIQRLLQEAIAQARVNHPNIVHIYYVGREGKTPFFAMELVPGATLADRLKDGPLPFATVVSIGEQVADALRHAADFDILHGDVKPSNILFADKGTVKLSDFGLARRLSAADLSPTSFAGTPAYLSPEAAEGRPTDIRSDMYSLGITLFEMTFGRLPYTPSGGKLVDFVQVHRTASIEFPSPWPDRLPYAWRGVLARLLAKSPADRYPNYEDLLADLRRLRPVDLPRRARPARLGVAGGRRSGPGWAKPVLHPTGGRSRPLAGPAVVGHAGRPGAAAGRAAASPLAYHAGQTAVSAADRRLAWVDAAQLDPGHAQRVPIPAALGGRSP